MSNPVLSEATFDKLTFEAANDDELKINTSADLGDDGEDFATPIDEAKLMPKVMTASGTVNKTIFLLLLTFCSSIVSYLYPFEGTACVLSLVGLLLAVIMSFKPQLSPYFSSLYSICEGFLLGTISYWANAFKGGIAAQAAFCTMVVLFVMLAIYRLRIIKVNQTFMMVLSAGLSSLMLFYLFVFIMQLLGFSLGPIYHGPAGIFINVAICLMASFCLLADFENINVGIQRQAPKFMEWYCAFSLLVSLVWIYLEILRFLMSRSNRD